MSLKVCLRAKSLRDLLFCSVFAGVVGSGVAWAQSYQVNITSNTTLNSVVAPPNGYSQVYYSLQNAATLTLAPPSSPTSTIYVTDVNTRAALINNATITTTGPAIAPYGYNYTGLVDITNNGAITATLSGGYAISTSVYGLGAITNSGTIRAYGGGGVYSMSQANVINSGTITADAAALNVFDSNAVNTGTLYSTGGVGLYASGNVGVPASNSGTIYGQTIGAQIFGYTLTNSGTISSAGTGVLLDGGAVLLNTNTGVINNGIGPGQFGYSSNVKIINYGIINGNVSFGALNSSYGTSNTFASESGSVLNGNLVLGSGNDTFVTTLANTGAGKFAGVTGTVTGGGSDTLHYLVTASATTNLSLPSPFTAVIFELSNNAKLTINGSNPQLPGLRLAGSGSVDLTADITASSPNQSLLDLTAAPFQISATASAPANQLAVISRGTLSETHPNLNTSVRLRLGNDNQ